MFGAHLPETLCDAFMEQCDATNAKKKVALRAAVELWIELPEDVRLKLLGSTTDHYNRLVEVVESVLMKMNESGELDRLVGKPKKK